MTGCLSKATARYPVFHFCETHIKSDGICADTRPFFMLKPGTERRVIKLFNSIIQFYEKILFFTCSLEDIVIAKLYSSRDTDRQDLLSENVLKNLDWDRLRHLALDENEAKASALNENRYRDLLYDYHEYVRSCCPNEKTDI